MLAKLLLLLWATATTKWSCQTVRVHVGGTGSSMPSASSPDQVWVKFANVTFKMNLTSNITARDIETHFLNEIDPTKKDLLKSKKLALTCGTSWQHGKRLDRHFYHIPLRVKIPAAASGDLWCLWSVSGLQGGAAGGRPVNHEEWRHSFDFVVQVHKFDWTQPYPFRNPGVCSGFIINRHVVTAGHCCTHSKSQDEENNPASYEVLTAHSSGWKRVTFVERHPKYQHDGLRYDVCVLQVEQSAVFQPNVQVGFHKPQPTNPRNHIEEVPAIGDSVQIAGFGETDTGSSGKLFASLPGSIKIVKCPRMKGYMFGHFLCAGSGLLSVASSCQGDSGAGWFQRIPGSRRVLIVGVNSHGYLFESHTQTSAPRASCGDPRKRTGMLNIVNALTFLSRHIKEPSAWTTAWNTYVNRTVHYAFPDDRQQYKTEEEVQGRCDADPECKGYYMFHGNRKTDEFCILYPGKFTVAAGALGGIIVWAKEKERSAPWFQEPNGYTYVEGVVDNIEDDGTSAIYKTEADVKGACDKSLDCKGYYYRNTGDFYRLFPGKYVVAAGYQSGAIVWAKEKRDPN